MQKPLLFCCYVLLLFVNTQAGCPSEECGAPWWAERRSKGRDVTAERSRRTSHVKLKVAQGTPVYMRCRAQGSPKPHIQWFKNGAPLSHKRHNMLFHKRALKLHRVKKADSGNYSCRASNSNGAITKNFYLTVMGPPAKERLLLLEGYPRNVTCFVGQKAFLTCRVLTNVPFTTRWLRYVDDIATLVETGDNVRQIRDSLEDFSDESSDSSPEEDIYIDYSDESDSGKRSKDSGSRSQEDEMGGNIQQRLWRQRHDLSMELDQSSSSSSQEDENDVRLIIQNVKLSDSGRYSCLVMSEHARMENSAWLTVHPVDEVELAYAERRELWQKRWGSDQGPEEYLRGIVIAVSVSSVLLIISMVVLFIMAILKAYRRQDVVLHIYDLRGRPEN